MAVKTKSKKTVTPLKDVEEPLKEVTVPGRFASPLTGEYVYPGDNNDGVTDAPYDKPKETAGSGTPVFAAQIPGFCRAPVRKLYERCSFNGEVT